MIYIFFILYKISKLTTNNYFKHYNVIITCIFVKKFDSNFTIRIRLYENLKFKNNIDKIKIL